MITLTQKHFISLLVAGAVVIGILLAQIFQNPNKVEGSVNEIANGSYSTSTYYASINSMASGGCVLLKGVTNTTGGPSSGKIGGVLENLTFGGVAKAGALNISFYDATSTNINLRSGNLATSSISLGDYYGGAASTTYHINANFNTGLTMCVTGTPASSTITWK